jgi:hypothetical protein
MFARGARKEKNVKSDKDSNKGLSRKYLGLCFGPLFETPSNFNKYHHSCNFNQRRTGVTPGEKRTRLRFIPKYLKKLRLLIDSISLKCLILPLTSLSQALHSLSSCCKLAYSLARLHAEASKIVFRTES